MGRLFYQFPGIIAEALLDEILDPLVYYTFQSQHLLASLNVDESGALAGYTFEDFSQDDYFVDLLTTRDELNASLTDARAAIGALKETNSRIEVSRAVFEQANAQLQKEIENRKRIEAAMQLAVDFQKKVLSTAATAIFTVDDRRRITSVNEELCQIMGYEKEELVGKNCSTLMSGDCRVSCDFFGVGEPGRISRKRCTFRTREGRRITVLKNADVVRNEAGSVIGAVESFVDVTHLIDACEKAEAAGRAKCEFLANMSHEIRTPMNGIIGMTDLALGTDLSSEQREYLDMARESAESLLRLLGDILDFSKIEAGKLEFERIEFSLRRSVGQTLKMLGVRASKKGLALACRIPHDVPDAFVGDPQRLRQVIVNLVGNAIKFTDMGEILIEVTALEQENKVENEGEFLLHFAVSDTGIGVPQEKQAEIFEGFSQADGSMTRRYGGTGLGLSISSQLVQLRKGRLWVERTPGSGRSGSTFHFTTLLETGKENWMKAVPENTAELAGMRVLIVDDNSTSRCILEEMVAGWGIVPTVVESAQAGLAALWSSCASAQRFDFLLLDSAMPEMDGFSLAERIRQNQEFADLRIVMLAPAGQDCQGERCRELGIDGTLTKPVMAPDLLSIVLRGPDNQREEPSPSTAADRVECPDGLRLLLVEDNLVNQRLALHILEKKNTVVVAGNGCEAVAAFDDGRFDMILMDVQMPEMNGFEATRIIREREKEIGGRMPILAMTAHAMKGDQEMCLEAGMDGYVSKPIKSDELFREMGRLVKANCASGEVPDAAETCAVIPVAQVYDRAVALEQVDGDEEFLCELAGVFLDNCPQLIAEINGALETGNCEVLQRAAHTVKGSVGTFCAGPVHDAALKLELIAREEKLDRAPEAFKELEARLAELLPVLTALAAEVPSQ